MPVFSTEKNIRQKLMLFAHNNCMFGFFFEKKQRRKNLLLMGWKSVTIEWYTTMDQLNDFMLVVFFLFYPWQWTKCAICSYHHWWKFLAISHSNTKEPLYFEQKKNIQNIFILLQKETKKIRNFREFLSFTYTQTKK